MKAVQMIGDTKDVGWKEALIKIVRNLPKNKELALEHCASYFVHSGEDNFTNDVYLKLGGCQRLMRLYVQNQNWTEAT
eukprot:14451980-Ditylum_brightwellii.AAC.1